jgi:hypothetical protein
MIAGDLGDGLSPRRPKSTPAGRAVPAHGPAPAPNQDGGQGRFMSRQRRPRVSASTGTAAAGSLTHSGRSDQSLLSGETAFRPGKSSSQPPDASHRSLTSKPTEQSQYFGCMCHSRSWPLYAVRVGLGEVQQRYVERCGLWLGIRTRCPGTKSWGRLTNLVSAWTADPLTLSMRRRFRERLYRSVQSVRDRK